MQGVTFFVDTVYNYYRYINDFVLNFEFLLAVAGANSEVSGLVVVVVS